MYFSLLYMCIFQSVVAINTILVECSNIIGPCRSMIPAAMDAMYVYYCFYSPLVFVERRSSNSSDDDMFTKEFCLQPMSDRKWTNIVPSVSGKAEETSTFPESSGKNFLWNFQCGSFECEVALGYFKSRTVRAVIALFGNFVVGLCTNSSNQLEKGWAHIKKMTHTGNTLTGWG